jgi:CheY-like chemotaxis protein
MILLRRGRFRAAGVVCLFAIWLMATAIIIQNRDPSSVAIVYYIALPVTGAWLFGFRAALGIAGLCAGGSLILAVWWQLVPAFPVFMPDSSFATWTMVVTATIITAAPVARVLQILKEALARGRSLQTALRESHDQLQGLLRRSSLQLAEARDMADAASRARIAFLAGLSRELRPPIDAILGFSTLVRSGRGLSEGQRRDVEVISRSGEQVLGFVRDALDLSMIEAGYALVVPADPTAPIETGSCRPELAGAEPRNDELGGLAPGQPEQRILIVEDPREGSGLLQHLLRNAGFRVAVDEDGIEGVESFRAWRPDLIWIDLCLPGESGVEAARRVRSLDWDGPVKLVAIAAASSFWQGDEHLADGVDGVVHKPYRRREIFDCLRRILGVRYNYGTNAHGTERGELLTPEALSVLPEKLCGELEEALVLLDVDRVTALIRRVERSYPAVGEMMASLAGNLAYTSMLHALTARKANLVEDRQ